MRRLFKYGQRDIPISDIAIALDQAIQEINALREAFENLRAYAKFERLNDEIKRLENKVIKQGDLLLSFLQDKES